MHRSLVDAGFYHATYPTSRSSGMSPADHYEKIGRQQGCWPTPYLDPRCYLEAYPDVKDAGCDPLVHYHTFGRNEGRKSFDCWAYSDDLDGKIVDIRGERSIYQIVQSEFDFLSAAILSIGNYNNAALGHLKISLFEEFGANKRLFTEFVDGRIFSYAEPFTFYFNPIDKSAGKLFRIEIASAEMTDLTSAWPVYLGKSNCRIPSDIDVNVGGSPIQDYGLAGRLWYSPPKAQYALPRRIIFSPKTQCNFNCSHCISSHTRSRAQNISTEIRERITEWASSNKLDHINSDYSGDVLWADYRSPGELDFLIELETPFHIDTNGVHLDDLRSQKLLKSKMRSLNVSLDAATTKTFNQIRRGSPDLSFVVGNLSRFVSAALNARWGGEISAGFTIMRSNVEEILDFIDLMNSIQVRRIVFRHLESYNQETNNESMYFARNKFNGIRRAAIKKGVHYGMIFHMPPPFTERPHYDGRLVCHEPWSGAVILGNGDVQACCIPGTKMGNLAEQSLEQIWNGKAYEKLRATVNSPRRSDVCRSCPMLRIENNSWSYTPSIAPHALPFNNNG